MSNECSLNLDRPFNFTAFIFKKTLSWLFFITTITVFQDQKLQIKAKIKPLALNRSNIATKVLHKEECLNGDITAENLIPAFLLYIHDTMLSSSCYLLTIMFFQRPRLVREDSVIRQKGKDIVSHILEVDNQVLSLLFLKWQYCGTV